MKPSDHIHDKSLNLVLAQFRSMDRIVSDTAVLVVMSLE